MPDTSSSPEPTNSSARWIWSEELAEDVLETGLQAQGRLLEGARQGAGDLVDRDAAGEFPRVRAAHAVAHREDEVGRAHGRRAGLAEVEDLPRIELQGRKESSLLGRTWPRSVWPDQCNWRASETYRG
ncbi:MAG: hypothetical protein WDO13_03755 [Verrucomicrobiota bacterium]